MLYLRAVGIKPVSKIKLDFAVGDKQGFNTNGCRDSPNSKSECTETGGSTKALRAEAAVGQASYLNWFKPAFEGEATAGAGEVVKAATQTCTEWFHNNNSAVPEVQALVMQRDNVGLVRCYFAAIRASTGVDPRGVVCLDVERVDTIKISGGHDNPHLVKVSYPTDGHYTVHDQLFFSECYLMVHAI